LIKVDPKSAEVIRPILRGRDIKRYGYDFANLWLLNTHNGVKEKGVKPININDYPAIKRHMEHFYPQLEKRLDKGCTPYNLRNCAYTEDFYKQKILWAETMRIHKNLNNKFPRFGLDRSGKFVTDKTCFFATGENLEYVIGILNSKVGKYLCSKYVSILDDGGYLMQKIYIEQIPIPLTNKKMQTEIAKLVIEAHFEYNTEIDNLIDERVYKLYDLNRDEIEFIEETQ
jgi:hypothetical protein